MIQNFLIGADIEAFLRDKQTQGIVSAEGIVKGSKYEPFNFDPSNRWFGTSLDNVLAEFTIPPTTDEGSFLSSILHCKQYIDTMDDRLCSAFIPCHRMDEQYLQTENAQTLGCEPDYDAWRNGAVNPRPSGKSTNLRTAGFHVHIGYDLPSVDMNVLLMKVFDVFVTLPAMLIEPDNERRTLYGKAGSFRHKEYGMEARTLSSFFASTPELIRWVFRQTNNAIECVNNFQARELVESERFLVAINSGDKHLAQQIVTELNINLSIAA